MKKCYRCNKEPVYSRGICKECWPLYHNYDPDQKTFYRYDRYCLLTVQEYTAIKETPAGWWIVPADYADPVPDWIKPVFILKDATKRYAQPTKQLALESFVARKKRQLRYLRGQMDNAEQALKMARAGLVDEKVVWELPEALDIKLLEV